VLRGHLYVYQCSDLGILVRLTSSVSLKELYSNISAICMSPRNNWFTTNEIS